MQAFQLPQVAMRRARDTQARAVQDVYSAVEMLKIMR